MRKFNATKLGKCLGVLTRKEKFNYFTLTMFQVFLSFLDLIGVALLGILGALAISGVESRSPGTRVGQALNLFNLVQKDLHFQSIFLAISAASVLTMRTFLSIVLTKKTFIFLSLIGAKLSTQLTRGLLNSSLLEIQKKSSQENAYALTAGVETVTTLVLGGASIIISDFSLLVVMTLGLLIVDPIIAISTLGLFIIIGLMIYFKLNGRARYLGELRTQLEVHSNEKIVEVLTSYRESVVRNSRPYYTILISDMRVQLSSLLAEVSFFPFIGKYILEFAVIFGGLIIGAIQFLTQDAVHAVAMLTIFMATASRIGPAVLRIQQSALQIKGNLGAVSPTLEMIDMYRDFIFSSPTPVLYETNHDGFVSSIKMEGVSVFYPGNKNPAVENIYLEIFPGEIIAVIGPSGAGKTSLVDLILGVIEPSRGSITISERLPQRAIEDWPGAISYVSQDTLITNSTVRENVSLGYQDGAVSDQLVWDALSKAHIDDFIRELPDGLDTFVGERGSRLSGGQRQRIGIARALLTHPKLLVLDEATSALDMETESRISKTINSLRGRTTIILIAHRLSTIREADRIIYLENGKIANMGKFDELAKNLPHFKSQIQEIGLT